MDINCVRGAITVDTNCIKQAITIVMSEITVDMC